MSLVMFKEINFISVQKENIQTEVQNKEILNQNTLVHTQNRDPKGSEEAYTVIITTLFYVHLTMNNNIVTKIFQATSQRSYCFGVRILRVLVEAIVGSTGLEVGV